MNKIKLFVFLFLLGIALPDASAQVSVRRSGSRTESSSSRRRDRKDDKKADKKDTPAAATAPGRAPVDTDRPGMTPVPPTAPPRAGAPTGDGAAATAPAAPAATRRTTPKKGKAPSTLADGVTQRRQSFDEYQRQEDGYIPWQHVVYRELDLTKEKNASLYYPTEPQDGLTNLFRVILDAFCNNRIQCYEYMDGRELFTEKYVVKVQDVLDKFSIYYQQKPGVGRDAKPIYVVDEMDVPSNEVLKYYIKERWEFDQKTSKYGPRILAICPILLRAGDFGGDAVPYPMFWVNYEDLRPMLREHLVMSDGMNNTPRFTMEEYFTLGQYEGDIYKVQNVRGLSLMQQYPNADTLQIVRAQIEAELRGFSDSIWVHEPTADELAAQDSIRAAKRAERRAAKRGNSSADKGDSADSNGKKNRRTKETVDMAAVEEAQEAKEDEIDQRVEQTGTAHSARRSARRR